MKCENQQCGKEVRRHLPKKLSNGFPPTEEQNEIFRCLLEELDCVMIEAGAGTGKTTTLRGIADVLPSNGQYTAFNSGLVADSKSKFTGTRVAANTFHSLAFRAVGKRYAHRLGGQRVKAEEIAHRLGIKVQEVVVEVDEKPKRVMPGFMAARVNMAIRKFCQSADQELAVSHFRLIDGIDKPGEYENNNRIREYLLPFAQKAWEDICDVDGTLPFTHDHYVKIWELGEPVIAADFILVDEAQDLSPVLLSVLGRQSGLKIFVGDSAQQIYEWRGAVNALASFPEAPRRYLSQSFRFGPAIADVANRVLEELEEGTDLRLKGFDQIPSRIEEVSEPTAILTRTNALAVATLLGAIAEGKAAFLVGGGADVSKFVRAAKELQEGKGTSHPDLACFATWTEVQDYSKEDEGEDLKLLVKLIDEFGCDPILEALSAMPKESEADLVISTAHKSKGREWDSVQLGQDFPTRTECGDPELKLLYVAVTRAKKILDISHCPFFTGEDGLDVTKVIASQPKPEPNSIIPPSPSTPPTKEEFTWTKWDEQWSVRGPAGSEVKSVTVTRKNGSTSEKHLKNQLWTDGTVSVYSI